MVSKNKQNVIILPTEEDVATGLAPYVAGLSEKTISEKGSFSVVLSGGTLIQTLRKLTECPYKETVNWSKWLIFWVDERVVPLNNPDSNYLLAWNGFLSKGVDRVSVARNYGLVEMGLIFWVDERVVPLDDPQSNYLLALNGFLSKVPIPKENIYPINYSPSAETVAQDYEAQLRKLVADKVLPLSSTGFPQFDLILLGVGPDGHVASLFPNRPQRYNKKDWVTFIEDAPKEPPKRITFTFPVINSATCIAMVVTDEEEADAVYITLEHKPHLPPLPCSEVKAQLNLSWFLNWDAASKLPSSTNKK
ncbi:UNVERIFIED_CONTAM: putative 6-phosphogluconolactonase 4, chloroplastic [Sesamum radiatum]|uniref:Probable 6-phosphogluconolactonase n=1 Tax=Sesamum radiatum TaxID=300843 RepID=A0AAW2K049_SESRA